YMSRSSRGGTSMQRRWYAFTVAALVPLFWAAGLRAAPVDEDKKDTATAKDEKKTPAKDEKKTESRVAVFRWNGALSEPPPQEDLFSFGPQAESLKDLVARLRKAADDSAVKAVVLTADNGSEGMAQVEE